VPSTSDPPATASGDVATALGSLLAGTGTGGILLAITVLVVRRVQASAPPTAPTAEATGATTLAVGTVAALAVAAGVAFARARAFGTRWQRVAVAAIAACGTAVPGLLAVPLDRALGTAGLVVIATASIACAILGWRATRGVHGAAT